MANSTSSRRGRRAAVCLCAFAATLMAACASGGVQPASVPLPEPPQMPFTAADVEFMTTMIPHHAQAVVMSRLAESRSSWEGLRVLAQRIIVAQQDEIALMRTWLADREQHVPAADATHHRHRVNGVEHDMLMPGMLSDEELARLEGARGAAFDRLYLTFMIRHHEGALTMVERLFGSYGAAQDETVFRFASDVFADQSSEIARMQAMLDSLPAEDG